MAARSLVSRIKRFLRLIPLTLKMIFLTAAVGMCVSGALGWVQEMKLNALLNNQLKTQLSNEATENRREFYRYMMTYYQAARLFAGQTSFANYIAGRKWQAGSPVIWDELPPWLPRASVLRLFADIDYAVLLDGHGNVMEIYRSAVKDIPKPLFNPSNLLGKIIQSQVFITSFSGVPYLLAGETIPDESGQPIANLILAHPLDDDFLLAAIKPVSGGKVVALAIDRNQRIVASNNPDLIPANTTLASLKGRYEFTGKAFLDIGEADIAIQFLSLISIGEFDRLGKNILSENKKQGMLMAAALIMSFMAIMLHVLQRIKQVNRRMEEFTRSTLELADYSPIDQGDQLYNLESRYLFLSEEVVRTKNMLLGKTSELRVSESRIRAIVDNVLVGILTLNEDRDVLSMNLAAEKIFRCEPGGYSGVKADDIVAMGGFDSLLVSHDRLKHMELTGIRCDGTEFPMEAALSIVDVGKDKVLITIIRDITVRKAFEERIRKSNEELELRVEERTKELTEAFSQLSAEAAERKKAEETLRRNFDIQRVISTVLNVALEPIPLNDLLSRILDVILSIPWLTLQSRGCIFLTESASISPSISASVSVSNGHGRRLRMIASRGLSDYLVQTCGQMEFGDCICGLAAERREIVFKDDIDEDHTIKYDGMMPHGHYCVPIISGDKTLGLINLYVRSGHGLDSNEVDFLSTIANTLTGIIEKKATEERLEHSQQLFLSFMKNSPMVAYIKDKDGVYVYVNEKMEEITGWASGEITGKTDFDLFPGETALEMRNHDMMALGVDKTIDIMEDVELKDGLHKWLSIKFPFRDEKGNRLLAGMSIDATARKRIENALKRTEEKYQNIINITSEGFVEINKDFEIINVNDSLCDMLVMERLELVGKKPLDSIDNANGGFLKDTPQVLASSENIEYRHIIYSIYELWEMHSVLSNGISIATNATFVRKDGTMVHTRLNASPIRGMTGNITGAFALLTDISGLVEMKDSLSRQALELKRSNQELADFASVASHDLQEPLRKVIAFGGRVIDRYADSIPEDGRDYLQRMQSAAQRMQRLIEGLLHYSRVTTRAQPFVPTPLDAVMKDVVSDLEVRIARSGGRVDVEPLPAVMADKLQMHQLLMNLVGNALKFQRPGVLPVVSVGYTEGEGGFVTLKVSDNGIGFDEKYLDRIFKPFQRLHGRNEYEGTGMGLAICDKIVTRHGWEITARSTPGEGTAFYVTIPAELVASKDA
ncbi:MAG: PAS domain S-box protein [Nitrospirae bacterium]|nr:PAS domain S-box protein [Nitrospirota bacterium]